MRWLTYSQGLLIEDPGLVATLAVFCQKIWLPYPGVGDSIQEVFESVGDPTGGSALAALQNDPARAAVRLWDDNHRELFSEQVFERLGGPRTIDHTAHRHDFDNKSVADIVGTDKSIYERLALRFHFTRGDLPGLELFDSGTAKSDVDLVRSVFFLNLPKVAAEPKALLDLRAEAQAHGLPEFWEMIEDEYQYAQAQGQPNMARAEKIRTDFDKWNRDRFTIRGYSIGLGLVTTLAAYSWVPSTGIAGAAEAILLGAAASSLPAWFGDLNARWAGYNKAKNKAFKCMSRIDRKIG